MFDDSPSQRKAEQRALEIVSRRLLDHGPGATFGRFTLEGTLGRGAHGHVYAASDPVLQRDVALKVVRCRRRSVGQALAEARALAAVEHRALVKIFEVVEHEDAVALVMERVRGQTLDAWVATRPSPQAIHRVFESIGRGLAAVHDAGLIHRDVKPANILVDDEGHPRIIDFGLALAGQPTGIRRSGTEATMAPEQLRGRGVGPWSDQYAWAVAYREALSQVCRRGRIPRRVEAVLRRAAAYRAEDRFDDLHAALAALARRRALGRGARWVLAAGVFLASGLAVPAHGDATCSADAAIELDFGAARAEATRQRVAALGGPLADEAAARVVARLSFIADRIDGGRREVCEAERVGQSRSGHGACLAELAAAMEQTVQSLEDGRLRSATDALQVVTLLGDPRQCAERAIVDEPTPASTRGRLQAKAAICASQTVAACRAAFEDELRGGERCGAPLDARYQRGLGLHRSGDVAGALEDLAAVAWRAEACERADIELDAKRLAGVLASIVGDSESSAMWLSAAEATLHRTGELPYRAARLELARGLSRVETAPDDAAEILVRAVDMLDAFGEGSVRERAVALINLGQARRRAGQLGAAEALRDGMELEQELYGPRSVVVAHTLVSLGGAMHAAGHLDAAERYLAEADSIYALHDSASRIGVARNRCMLAREREDLERAAEHCTTALDVATRTRELPPRVVLDARAALALVWAKQGQLERAATTLQSLREQGEDGVVPPGLLDEWTANHGAIEHVRGRYGRAAELWCSVVGREEDVEAPWSERLHRGQGCVAALVADGAMTRALEIGQPLLDALPEALLDAPEAIQLRARLSEARAPAPP